MLGWWPTLGFDQSQTPSGKTCRSAAHWSSVKVTPADSVQTAKDFYRFVMNFPNNFDGQMEAVPRRCLHANFRSVLR